MGRSSDTALRAGFKGELDKVQNLASTRAQRHLLPAAWMGAKKPGDAEKGEKLFFLMLKATFSSPSGEGSGLCLGGQWGEEGCPCPAQQARSLQRCWFLSRGRCILQCAALSLKQPCFCLGLAALQHPLPGEAAAPTASFGVVGTSCLLHLHWGSCDHFAPLPFKPKSMELSPGLG